MKVRNENSVEIERVAKALARQKGRKPRKLMGDILREAGLITTDQLATAIEEQRRHPARPLKTIISTLGFATKSGVERALDGAGVIGDKKQGEHLLSVGLITRTQLSMIIEEQGRYPLQRLGPLIVGLGFATQKEINRALRRTSRGVMIRIAASFTLLSAVLLTLLLMPSSEDNMHSEIERLDNEIRQNPRDKALVQANLSQIGDIFLKSLKEYHQATAIYEEILRRFPRWEGNDAVYPRLAECYEALGDGEGAQSTYERMIEFFPAASPEYISARAKVDD